jgi:hypothetical protein
MCLEDWLELLFCKFWVFLEKEKENKRHKEMEDKSVEVSEKFRQIVIQRLR